MAIRDEVRKFASLGPLPESLASTEEQLKKIQEALESISPPASREEAELPQSSPTAPENSTARKAGDIALGAVEGTAKLVWNVGKFAVLNIITLGGYGTYTLWKGIWQGYKEQGVVGALNSLNPLYGIAKGGADTYLAIDKGDYRAAGAAGAQTAILWQGLRASSVSTGSR